MKLKNLPIPEVSGPIKVNKIWVASYIDIDDLAYAETTVFDKKPTADDLKTEAGWRLVSLVEVTL